MNKTAISLVFALVAMPVMANTAEESRFSGEIALITGLISTNSNLSTQSDDTINGLDSKGDSTVHGIILPLGKLTYALNDDHSQRLYIGTSREDIAVGTLAFELGYQFDLESGTTVDVSFLPTVMSGEVWSNPYLEGQARSETDQTGNAYRLQLTNINQSAISLDLAYATQNIENDAVPYETLKRDSKAYYIKVQYLKMFDRTSGFAPSLRYIDHSADGKAESFTAYEAEFSYFFSTGSHGVALTGSYSHRPYQAVNQVFAEKREDNVFDVFATYEYSNIENWKNWGVTALAGYTLNHSNIDFYSSNELLLLAGLIYKF